MTIPETYRLVAVFNGTPLTPVAALERAGLRTTDPGETLGRHELTDEERTLLRTAATAGWIRWVPGQAGYILTPCGDTRLDAWFQHYGPAFPVRAGQPSAGTVARTRVTHPLGVA